MKQQTFVIVKSYKMYIRRKLDELKLLLDFDNMLYEGV